MVVETTLGQGKFERQEAMAKNQIQGIKDSVEGTSKQMGSIITGDTSKDSEGHMQDQRGQV